MSRAVQEDLSGLSFGERTAKRWGKFKLWAHNPEKKTYFGERSGIEWGQLLGYYLVFYAFLAGFTSIFFGVLGFMLPPRPVEEVRGICSQAPNALDACGQGPFFQAMDLSEVGAPDESKHTDGIFKFGICEPAFVAIPRALALGSTATPTNEYNNDDNRRGYKQFNDEVDRVFCQGSFFDTSFNPDCSGDQLGVNTRILPLIPLSPSEAAASNRTFRSPDQDDFVDIASQLSGPGKYERPLPIYKFGPNNEYETYIVFFRFNKVWNYQPYDVDEAAANTEPEIQNNIGITCYLPDACPVGTPGGGMNYNSETVPCDGKTVSRDQNIVIQMFSNVMTNYDGFPWRGGALNMNFGSMAVTYKNDGKSIPDDFTIKCDMGEDTPIGFNGVSNDGSPVAASAKSIQNFDKQGPARLYTRSDGSDLEIEVNN